MEMPIEHPGETVKCTHGCVRAFQGRRWRDLEIFSRQRDWADAKFLLPGRTGQEELFRCYRKANNSRCHIQVCGMKFIPWPSEPHSNSLKAPRHDQCGARQGRACGRARPRPPSGSLPGSQAAPGNNCRLCVFPSLSVLPASALSLLLRLVTGRARRTHLVCQTSKTLPNCGAQCVEKQPSIVGGHGSLAGITRKL